MQQKNCHDRFLQTCELCKGHHQSLVSDRRDYQDIDYEELVTSTEYHAITERNNQGVG